MITDQGQDQEIEVKTEDTDTTKERSKEPLASLKVPLLTHYQDEEKSDSTNGTNYATTFLSSKEEQNTLKTLYDYFIKETSGDPIPFQAWEKISLGLELLGGTAGIYSWPPAKKYGEGKALWISYSLQVTNPLSNVLFLINATDNLFDSISIESRAPKELMAIIELTDKKTVVKKYVKMILGSIVCAIPFGIVTYLFPLPGCDSSSCLAVTVSHSLICNTILHAVSWNLILTDQYWYYRLPTLPFEKAYECYNRRSLKEADRKVLSIRKEREIIYQKYKNLLCGFFISSVENIVNDRQKKLLLNNPEKSNLSNLVNDPNSSIEMFSQFASRSTPPPPPPPSRLRSICSSAHRFLSNGGIGFTGASFMVVACIGFVANPIYVVYTEGLTIAESIIFGSIPSYSTGILCAFYGAGIFNQIYQYFTSWDKGISDKFSFESKLYPKTFGVFLLFNLYISFFAYGTGQQLIITVFGDEMWDEYRPTFEDMAIPAFQILSFIPLLSLFNSFVRKSVAKFGKMDDETLAARLLVKTSVMGQRLQQANGELLVKSIQSFSEQQQRAFGIDPQQFNQDVEILKRLNLELSQTESVMKSTASSSSSGTQISCCRRFLVWNRNRGNNQPDQAKKALLDSTEDSEKVTTAPETDYGSCQLKIS